MPRRSLRQVLATQRVLFEREVLANSEVVHPQRARPRRIGPGLALVEEQHVSLHPTGVEDSGRQPKQRMHVELSEQAASYDLTRPALEQHVAGNGGPRARDVRAHAAAASRRRRDELRGPARRVRREIAARCAGAGFTLEETAMLRGYADLSSFHRARRRWRAEGND